MLVIALGPSCYLWNNDDGSITKLFELHGLGRRNVCSVGWSPDAVHLGVGFATGEVEVWDAVKLKRVRSYPGIGGRVAALSWQGSDTLATGNRSGEIALHDQRLREAHAQTVRGHEEEVCGLKWSSSLPSGSKLASGGNDNRLNIWDLRRGVLPLFCLTQHRAAVKALSWCPWQRSLLASGGGTNDRMIRFWNTHTGECVQAVDTHSQVCDLEFSLHDREIISAHGFSRNRMVIWKYPSLVKVAELSGHTSRVLHIAQSPDGIIASAGADETLRFWRIRSPTARGDKDSSWPVRFRLGGMEDLRRASVR